MKLIIYIYIFLLMFSSFYEKVNIDIRISIHSE